MKIKVLTIALLLLYQLSSAQTAKIYTGEEKPELWFRSPPQPDSLSALIVINDNKYFRGPAILGLIPTNDIETLSVMNEAEAKNVYGDEGKYGALLISIKKPLKWVTLKQLFRQFNISKKDWGLDVMVNRRKMLNKDQYIVCKSWVKNITIGERVNSLKEKTRYISLNNENEYSF
ncbi:MAG: hypothetical protein EOO42_00300 [Flavobacteriales bacterium]|nr:MAG: hypothetical protein EOO42_00300 [Flavobacteriales bacterium]